MIEVLTIYIPLILSLSVIDESWNCNNPRPKPLKLYYACEWSESDMFLHKGNWILRPRDMHDNFIERIYRRKYWEELGYDNNKIRLKSKETSWLKNPQEKE